jgi:flagellar biosynthetic protein FlhB/type III secretion protein U
MSDAAERSIPATPRRRAAAREDGAAPNAAIPAFVALVAAAVLLLPGWAQTALPAAGGFMRESLAAAFATPHDGGVDHRLLFPAQVLLPTAALVVATAGAGLCARFFLDGSAWRLARAAPRWRRIDPFSGVARVFSLATCRAIVWNGLCLAVLVATAAFATGPLVSVLQAPGPLLDAAPAIAALRGLLLPVLLAAAAVAAAQWGVARLAFERRLRMTPDEFKEEMRSMEADTKIKFDRRRK